MKEQRTNKYMATVTDICAITPICKNDSFIIG